MISENARIIWVCFCRTHDIIDLLKHFSIRTGNLIECSLSLPLSHTLNIYTSRRRGMKKFSPAILSLHRQNRRIGVEIKHMLRISNKSTYEIETCLYLEWSKLLWMWVSFQKSNVSKFTYWHLNFRGFVLLLIYKRCGGSSLNVTRGAKTKCRWEIMKSP
jgi:hypothetical protein